jgi:hypothetical protein
MRPSGGKTLKNIVQVVLILGLAANMRGQTTAPSSSTSSQDTNAPGSPVSGTQALPVVYAVAATEPFQQEVDLSIGPANSAAYASIPVPSGKRLVIEYLSLFGNLPAGQKLSVSLATVVSGLRASYRPQINTQDAGDGTVSVSANQVMRVYGDPGTIVSVSVTRNSPSGSSPLTVSVSGYYMSLP